MSTITITIDTDHLDPQAVADLGSILRRSIAPAAHETAGLVATYPVEVVMEESLEGWQNGTVARFGFDKNKPRL